MCNIVWIEGAIFLFGFFHGLRGDHLLEMVNSQDAQNIYERPSWISFKLSLRHLGYLLCLIIPLVLIKIGIPAVSLFPSHSILGIFFLAVGMYSFYEFFWLPPKLLHQHDHPHQHAHSHLHQKRSKAQLQIEHVDHSHQLPHNIDMPRFTPSEHIHPHYHQHGHLHFHTQKKKQNHLHYHYSRLYKRLGTPQNILLLFTLSLTGLVFPLSGILLSLVNFFLGLFLSIYLLQILYRGKGINLMEKIAHVSSFLLGLTGGLVGFWLFW